MTKHPPHFVTHENTGEDPKTARPYAFAVQAVSPRNDLDHCDIQVTPEQFELLRGYGALYADATYPADGWVRGENLVWIDTGDLSPGGLDIDDNGNAPEADFILARIDSDTDRAQCRAVIQDGDEHGDTFERQCTNDVLEGTRFCADHSDED